MQKPHMPRTINNISITIATTPHVGMPTLCPISSAISRALSPAFRISPFGGVDDDDVSSKAIVLSTFSTHTHNYRDFFIVVIIGDVVVLLLLLLLLDWCQSAFFHVIV